MSATVALALVVWLSILVAAALILNRARLWRVGQSAPVDWIAGLKALPKRYLVDVHHIVARDREASRMHMLVAGGLVAGSALAALGVVPALGQVRIYWALVALIFAIMLVGGFLVGRRRFPTRPPKLSGGAFQRLPFLLTGYALGAFLVALSAAIGSVLPALAWAGLVLAAAGGFGLALQLGQGPMRHAVTGALHLVAHPRPGRFEGKRETALLPLNLNEAKLGVETPADFGWNRLLSFDACIQCGRCEVACPAFAAGQPLNPKKLIQDLAATLTGNNAAYAGRGYPHAPQVSGVGSPHGAITGADAMIHPDTLWSCTTCRACVEECPMTIEHVDAIMGLRRFQTLELGAVPEKAELPLSELRGADEPGGRALARRTDFAAGMDLRVLREGETTDILLWLGEGAYDLRVGRTLRALVKLLALAKVDFAVLGATERDTGDLARRLGDEATFQRLARDNIATLSRHRFRRILTADPHVLHALRNEYPAFGGRYEVVHHTAFLDELVAAGRLKVASAPEADARVTYHDPCYLGRYNGETEAPRRLLDRIGVARVEMERHGKRSMCCGGGGGAPVSDIEGERRIPDIRMEQAKVTGARILAVACPTCTGMLEGVTGERPEVLDVAELLLRAVEGAA